MVIKNGISFVQLDGIPNHESIWCKVNMSGTSILVGGIYRQPKAPLQYLIDLHEYLCAEVNDRTKLILTGDFNLPGINWTTLTNDKIDEESSEQLLQSALSFCLDQLVLEATRISGTASSTLDLLFVSNCLKEFKVTVEDGISDHKLLVCTYPLCNTKPNKRFTVTVKNYAMANDVCILDYLETQFDQFSHMCDVDEMWCKFKDIITYCETNFVPNRKKTINRMNPWITRNIIHMKRRLKRRRRNKLEVQELSRELTLEINSARARYFNITLPNFLIHDPQKFWRYLSRRESHVSQFEIDGAITVDPETISSGFNYFFQSVFSRALEDECEPENIEVPVMPNLEITQPGILSLLLNLNVKKSAGPDGISGTILRRYAEWLSHYLYLIFVESLRSSRLPDDWRCAKIVPIHKTGNKHLITNYRPISLTSTTCKLIEHIICKAITKHIEENDVLYSHQHGFRARLSTVTQLLEVTHDFALTINDRQQTDAIFIDLSKAFDRVPHQKLISKLQSVGISHALISWIYGYLVKRKQYVTLNGSTSGMLDVFSGVPQGSVLGPLLFLIYVNDLPACVDPTVKVRLFADDCVIYTTIAGPESQIILNKSLQNISLWCKRWGMKINHDKTAVITITNKKNPLEFSYMLDNKTINKVNEIKYLGVTISSNLKWETRVTNVCSNAFKKLGFLRRKLKISTSATKLSAYKALVRPVLEYASIIWSPYQDYLDNKLEKVQRIAVRFIYSNYSWRASVTAMLANAKLDTLKDRRKIASLKFLYALYQQQINIEQEKYLKAPFVHSKRTNHNKTIRPYSAKNNTFEYSFSPRVIDDWNKLLEEIVNSTSAQSFAETLTSML
ncbi:uncharacterized protein ISCGN_013200 [Ixodes scapularis]